MLCLGKYLRLTLGVIIIAGDSCIKWLAKGTGGHMSVTALVTNRWISPVLNARTWNDLELGLNRSKDDRSIIFV